MVMVTRTPWHLWVIGGVTLLWNAVGAMDYTLTELNFEPYLSGFTPEQREYFASFPAWVVGFWAVAVWGSLLGSVLLLLRRRSAVGMFGVAFVAAGITAVHNFALSNPSMVQISGPGSLIFMAIILIIAVAEWEYARRMARDGILR